MQETSYIYLATTNSEFMDQWGWRRYWKTALKVGNITEKILKELLENKLVMKIGESRNIIAREKSLPGYKMVQIFEFEGDKADRLFIESFVRAKIKNSFGVMCPYPSGLDYFKFINVNFMKAVNNRFLGWCEEAYDLLQKM